MSESELLYESLSLLVIGMGIVFGFLLLLVGILRGMSAFALKIAPAEMHPAPTAAPIHATGSESDDLVAVITAAVARYRQRP
ncbi:OadG family protein [Thiorhodococcus mannitoliphagus]|uniref:Probable oxaloacetate decarboxylase gamma chain n=1 Tax=Thiorhodococcus mannitoliphagus TaxID=329406 RepID=A0A6P1DYQ1_9GAMM|nr:OadG family protein [Thiorhodococcus mannitoliphagus]NEX20834.1 OadG family protein [Thiorhodococcus mannitoliphagus]